MGFFDTVFDVVAIGTKAAISTAYGVTKATLSTAGDVIEATSAACKGDYDKTGRILVNRAEQTICGIAKSVGTGLSATCEVADHAIDCIGDSNKTFLDSKTKKNLTALASIGLVSYVGCSLVDDDCSYETDNGMFQGDSDDLYSLAKEGELEGTEHLENDEYDRNISARNEFLRMHGYDSVPEGYEVHHIVPLCEGGEDSPDNMILVSDEEHDIITAEHRRFYDWNR